MIHTDPVGLQYCMSAECTANIVATCVACMYMYLTESSQNDSVDVGSPASKYWRQTPHYNLTLVNSEEVHSPTGWLSDSVIAAAQLFIQQQFPSLSGLGGGESIPQTNVLSRTNQQMHGSSFTEHRLHRKLYCTITDFYIILHQNNY